MSKQPKPTEKTEPNLIPTSRAVQVVATRLVEHEQKCLKQFKALEEKIGEHDNTFTENDADSKYNAMLELVRNLNKTVVSLTQRCEVLEKQNNIKTKKKGTMPLSELTDPPSFTTEE
jgi:hypothetical protein